MPNFQTQFDEYYAKALELFRQKGSTAEVYEHIQAIDDEDYRERTFEKMAHFLAEQRNLKEAVRYCGAINRALGRADALFEVGCVLKVNRDLDAARDLFRQAVAAAARIECPYDEASLLLQVADQMETLGNGDEALALVHRAVMLAKPLPQDFGASKALRGCARILAKWNRLSEAIQVAEVIDSRWSELRQTTLEEIHGRGQWPVRPGANPEDDD